MGAIAVWVPVRFDDHPNHQCMRDRIETRTADPVPDGLSRTGPGLPAIRVML
jgi:hypothetical protein